MTEPSHSNITSQGVLALFEDVAQALATLGGETGVTLWYLGEKAERFLALPTMTGTGITIGDLSMRLDGYADEVASALLRLDRHMLGNEASRLAWDASLVSDLSPYTGDLQLNASRFLFMADCLSRPGNHVFLVDEARLGQVLAQAGADNGLALRWRGQRTTAPSLAAQMRARLSALQTAWRHKQQLRVARRNAPAPWDKLRDCDVLVLDWAETGSFLPGQAISHTRNLRRLPGILKAAGHKVGFVVNAVSWTQPFQGIAENVCASADAVVLADECRPWGAVLRGAWESWLLDRSMTGRLVYNGVDLTRLVRLVRERDNATPQASLTFAYMVMARELARRGIRPKTIVYPYENQGWERAFLAGARKWLPQTRMVAYQFAPFAARYLSFYPFVSDVEHGRVPDRLLCMADHFANLFRAHGFPAQRLSIGGTMMFEDVLVAEPRPPQISGTATSKTILCATSIKFSESLNLVQKVINAAQGQDTIKVVVNFHPVVDADFKARMRSLLDAFVDGGVEHVEFTSQQTRMILDQVAAVFYNTSGAAFDALARSVPAFYVPVDGGISQNKVPQALSSEPLDAPALRGVIGTVAAGKIDAPCQDPAALAQCLLAVQEDAFIRAMESSL